MAAYAWLRKMKLITSFPIKYEDYFARRVERSDVNTVPKPCSPSVERCDLLGTASSVGSVTVFRGAVTKVQGEYVYSADPARIDPQKGTWAAKYRLDDLSPVEKAIFVLSHENHHVLNPIPAGTYDNSDEWLPNFRGQQAVEEFRKRMHSDGP